MAMGTIPRGIPIDALEHPDPNDDDEELHRSCRKATMDMI